jgi:IS30 family transposase
MIQYNRISFLEREEISRQLVLGSSLRTIAYNLKRAPSSISREIRQSKVVELQYYRAIFAQQQSAKTRHKIRQNRKFANNFRLRKFVISHLAKNWSPEQIAKRLILLYPDDMDMRISHQTIYSYIYVLPRGTLKLQLVAYLRRHHKHCHKRKPGQRGGPITDYLSIEERPKEVENRIIPGHWEGDMLVGSRHDSCMGTLVERTTRMTLLVKLATQSSSAFRKAFTEKFRHLPRGLKNTLTYDQGKEMAQHKLFTKETKLDSSC